MANMNWGVAIRGVQRGFVVEVGCKQMVFLDSETKEFLADLAVLMSGDHKMAMELREKYFPEEFEKFQLTEPPPTPLDECERVVPREAYAQAAGLHVR